MSIQKTEISLNNPDPETLIEAGDKLVLFGRSDQVECAVKYLTEMTS